MADFINKLNELYLVITQKNFTVAECVSSIDHQRFHLWLMLPSSLLIIAMSFTVQRKNLFRGILDGRPGAIFPMDILGRSNRFTYVAAWGTIAFLAADGILIGQRVVKFEGKKSYAAAGNAILSMLVYGLGYFPLFASLAMDSFFGYIVGTTYAWMLFVIHIYKEQECDLVYQARVVFVMRDLPLLLCLGYLSVCLPVRVVRTYRKRGFSLNKDIESASVLKNPQKVYKTPEAELVKKLLAPPTIPHPEPDGIKDKILASMKSVVANVLYQPQKGFRYSARILSVMCVGVLVLYKTSLEMLAIWVKMCYIIENHYDHVLDTIGREKRLNDSTEITNARTTAKFVLHGVDIVRGTVVSAVVLALVLGLVQVLHMLSSYRLNLQDLYKGNTIHIPHRDDGWKASLLVGTMKYAGYQVGYITWGFMVHTVLLLIIAFVLVVVIELLLHGYTAWLVHVIETLWPIVLVTLIVNYGQLLLAKFVFLQGSGDTLDIDNRRTLFILIFFLFFYNIFIGLFSCLFRIIKSIVIGAIFLPRLDHSALPRRFQMMDPGFAAYVGFIHVEAVHSNPVLLTFLRLLMLQHHREYKETDREFEKRDTADRVQETVFDEKNHVDVKTKKISKAKLRWQIAYTLFRNPQIRTQRKSYLDGVKEMQERLAKKYNLSSQDACVLFDNMTTMSMDVEQIGLALEAPNYEQLLSTSSNPWKSLRAGKITQVLKSMTQKRGPLGVSDKCVKVELY